MYIPPGIPQAEAATAWQQAPVGYPIRENLESFFVALEQELDRRQTRLAMLQSYARRLPRDIVSPAEPELAVLPSEASLSTMELAADRFGWRLPVTSQLAWNRQGVLELVATNGFPGETHTLENGRLISRGLALASIVQGQADPFLVEAINVPAPTLARFGPAPFRYREGLSWHVSDTLLWADFRLTLEQPLLANSFRLFLGERTRLTRVAIVTAQDDRITPPVLAGFAYFPEVPVAAVEFRLESDMAVQTEIGFWVGELQAPMGGVARERLWRDLPAPSLSELGYTVDPTGQIRLPTSMSKLGNPTSKPQVEFPLQAVLLTASAERREVALYGLELGREEYAAEASAVWKTNELPRGFGRIKLRYLPAPGNSGIEIQVRRPGESVSLPVLPGEEFTVSAGRLEVAVRLFRDQQFPASTPILQSLEVEHLAAN